MSVAKCASELCCFPSFFLSSNYLCWLDNNCFFDFFTLLVAKYALELCCFSFILSFLFLKLERYLMGDCADVDLILVCYCKNVDLILVCYFKIWIFFLSSIYLFKLEGYLMTLQIRGISTHTTNTVENPTIFWGTLLVAGFEHTSSREGVCPFTIQPTAGWWDGVIKTLFEAYYYPSANDVLIITFQFLFSSLDCPPLLGNARKSFFLYK